MATEGRWRAIVGRAVGAVLALWVAGCGEPLYERTGPVGQDGDASVDGPGATGGRGEEEGGTGGSSGSGGSPAGGSPSTGGLATGGAAATGGALATGGRPASGGMATGGSAATGGMLATGGTATGGAPATGGMATGGAVGTGGVPATGGSVGTGGSAGSGTVTGALLHVAFDETSGTIAHDTAGTSKNGTLNGATFAAGRFGNAASFSGTDQYISFPGGLTSSLTDMTVAFWVNLAAKTSFARAIDFGNGSATGYWYVSPSFGNNGILRFGISQTDWQKEQSLDAPALPLSQWKHVAVVVAASGITIYVDGAVAATSTSIVLRPKDVGASPNDWLGRSQYSNDAYLNGRLDDLYIFGRALSATEIAALMSGP